jgi:hypothetical protein
MTVVKDFAQHVIPMCTRLAPSEPSTTGQHSSRSASHEVTLVCVCLDRTHFCSHCYVHVVQCEHGCESVAQFKCAHCGSLCALHDAMLHKGKLSDHQRRPLGDGVSAAGDSKDALPSTPSTRVPPAVAASDSVLRICLHMPLNTLHSRMHRHVLWLPFQQLVSHQLALPSQWRRHPLASECVQPLTTKMLRTPRYRGSLSRATFSSTCPLVLLSMLSLMLAFLYLCARGC